MVSGSVDGSIRVWGQWPNENKISYRRSAARPVQAGLRVCSTGRDARSLLAASVIIYLTDREVDLSLSRDRAVKHGLASALRSCCARLWWRFNYPPGQGLE